MRLFTLLAVALALAPAAQAGPIVDRTVGALRDDPVYVDPAAERRISEAEAAELRNALEQAESGPIYVAILPAAAGAEAGGDPVGVARQLAARLGRRATYAVVVGDSFRALSGALPRGEAARLATRAFEERSSEGVAATLGEFVALVTGGAGPETPVEEPPAADDGGGIGGVAVLVPLIILGAIGFFLFRMFSGRRRAPAWGRRDLEEVKETAREDLYALAEDVSALEAAVDAPGASPEAKAEYMRALDLYERGSGAYDRARSPADLEEVSAALEEGRYAMEVAKARLAGREPPVRRAPCFFDPRHGPSAREVEWTPPWGATRLVPVCEADAQRIEAGDEPEPREVLVDGRRRPWWDGTGAYGPYAGGYFGGTGGLFAGLFAGSLLSDAFDPDTAGASGGEDWGGDLGGGGDFGGGGGDFGGGGGDFGGGGGDF